MVTMDRARRGGGGGGGGGGLVHKDEGEGAGRQVEEWFRWLHPISGYVGSGRIYH